MREPNRAVEHGTRQTGQGTRHGAVVEHLRFEIGDLKRRVQPVDPAPPRFFNIEDPWTHYLTSSKFLYQVASKKFFKESSNARGASDGSCGSLDPGQNQSMHRVRVIAA
jgi:hypothetical protein